MDGSAGLPYRAAPEGTAGVADGHESSSGSISPPLQSKPVTSRSRLNQQEVLALKPVIRRLYIDDGLTFVQLAKVLEKDYKFSITKRQFSSLQNKWGWKKNTRASDRKKILNKLKDDDKSISVEGRVGTVLLNVEKLNRWKKEFEREPVSIEGQVSSSNSDHLQNARQSQQRSIFRMDPQVNQRIPLARQPSPPKVFYVSELLASSMRSYVTGMFDQGAWDFSEGMLGANIVSGDSPKIYILDDFMASTMATINLLVKGSYVEARRVLTTALDLVRNIMEQQDILLLSYVMQLFSLFRNKRNESALDILNLLRSFIARMSTAVLPREHPLRLICHAFGYMDLDVFDENLLFSMELVTRLMATKLGPLHKISLDFRSSYLKFRQESALEHGREMDHVARETEISLRNLLKDANNQASQNGTTPGYYVVLGMLATFLRSQSRFLEAENVSHELLTRAQAEGEQLEEAIGSLGIAMSQYLQGKTSLAEVNQRRAADINLQRNDSDSLAWAIAHLTLLEEWLREWGRLADADELHVEISELIIRNNNNQEEEQLVEI